VREVVQSSTAVIGHQWLSADDVPQRHASRGDVDRNREEQVFSHCGGTIIMRCASAGDI
jgi:hypothetical protein